MNGLKSLYTLVEHCRIRLLRIPTQPAPPKTSTNVEIPETGNNGSNHLT